MGLADGRRFLAGNRPASSWPGRAPLGRCTKVHPRSAPLGRRSVQTQARDQASGMAMRASGSPRPAWGSCPERGRSSPHLSCSVGEQSRRARTKQPWGRDEQRAEPAAPTDPYPIAHRSTGSVPPSWSATLGLRILSHVGARYGP